jgi:hypothetical protein
MLLAQRVSEPILKEQTEVCGLSEMQVASQRSVIQLLVSVVLLLLSQFIKKNIKGITKSNLFIMNFKEPLTTDG